MDPSAARRLADAHAAHAAACAAYARSLTGGEEDAAQEAFVRLARHLAAGRAVPDAPRAWLLAAVRSAAFDARRRDRRRRARESASAAFDPATDAPPADLDRAAAESALMTLPVRQREAVALRLWCGLTFPQAAALMGVAPSTAHADYAAAINALRRILDPENHDERRR